MADKAEKIAAAKKKLKQYQSKSKPDKAESSGSGKVTPVSQLASEEEFAQQNTPAAVLNGTSSNIANYFRNSVEMDDIFIPPAPVVSSGLASINQLSEDINNFISSNSHSLITPTTQELQNRNIELASILNSEKLQNDELNLRLRNQNSVIDELKMDIDKLKVENSTKLTSEMGSLQEQLQHHIQTVGILVGEKAELTASLNRYQKVVREKSSENDELQNRLKASRSTVQKLEKEIESMKKSNSKYGEMEEKINSELSNYQKESVKFKKLYEDLQEDLSELKQKLLLKSQENSILQEKTEKTNSELDLCKLRIEQLSGSENRDFNAQIESITQQNFMKTQQINELQEMIKQMGTERDSSNQQYQNYVLHLNKDMSNLATKMQEVTMENSRLSHREDELVRHISELEKQIQLQLTKQHTYSHQNDVEDTKTAAMESEMKILREKVSNMEMERAEYMKQNENVEILKREYEDKLRESNEIINDLQLTVERLQMDKPDVAKLITEIESGKVGASRACAQNVELKLQLEEMQRAFVHISNDKLELTDKLQTELHLCKEMKTNYSGIETELASTREKLHYKDEEMIRLAHETTELNKQIFQQNQELDRLRYYEARSNDNSTLQIELQNSKELVKMLQNKIKQFEPNTVSVECDSNQNVKDGGNCLTREIETLKCEKEELLKVINNFQNRKRTIDEESLEKCEVMSDNASTVTIPNHEAMEKLQERFKRTMVEVADLTEEKQRLEHIVLQLQGETETIGEYITLYQQQRRLLKQKDMERDFQLQHLADDREKMKLKLKELNFLVHQLVIEKGGAIKNGNHGHNEGDNIINFDNRVSDNEEELPKAEIKSTETAGRILSLLSDIKTANITYGSGVQNCSCCSGKLETV